MAYRKTCMCRRIHTRELHSVTQILSSKPPSSFSLVVESAGTRKTQTQTDQRLLLETLAENVNNQYCPTWSQPTSLRLVTLNNLLKKKKKSERFGGGFQIETESNSF